MANEIKLKRSAVANNAPAVGDLALGEIAINTNDGRVFIKKNDGVDAVVDITDNVRTKTTTDPIATNDNSDGYRPGDLWLNTTSSSVFICVDDSNTAAVWTDLTGGGGAVTVVANQGDVLHTLDNPNAYGTATQDYFGQKGASDSSGNYTIISASAEDDAGGTDSGKAYIFNISTGKLVRTIDNPNPFGTTLNDQFSYEAVGISGDKCIIGASFEDSAAGVEVGRAYIFNFITGELLHTLDNPNAHGVAAGDYFGVSVAISGDRCIVGTSNETDAGGPASGKAYIFDVTTGALLYTLDNPNAYSISANDYFGIQVSISGNNCIVSAYGEDDASGLESGKAYIFNVTTGALSHTLDNPNPVGTSAGDYFGWDVDISGNNCVVSAYAEDDANTESGKAYIFNVTTGALLFTLDNPNAYGTSYNDYFGRAVAISSKYCVIGVPYEDAAPNDYAGKVYVFDVTTGALIYTLDDPNAYGTSLYDYFGNTVSISGAKCVVGATYESEAGGLYSGKAYILALEDILEFSADNILKELVTVDGPGSCLDADLLDGREGDYFAPKDYVDDLHDRGGGLIHNQYGLMHTIDNPNAFGTAYGDFFGGAGYGNSGASSAVSGDYMVIGAPNEDEAGGNSSGKVYIFNIHTGLLCRVIDNPNAYGTSGNDNFGIAIDISGDKCVIAAPQEDESGPVLNSGKVYVFSVPSGELLLTIDNPNGYGTSSQDRFGEGVAIDGNNCLVSAFFEDDIGGLSSGKVYIFNATTGALLQTLDNPNAYGTSANDQFGKNLSISGDKCIVGAPYEDDASGNSSGKAYIFTVSTGALLQTLDNPNAFGTGAYDNFGLSVGIDGNYVVVGAPWEDDGLNSVGKAYIFNATTGALLFTLDDPNAFGTTYYDSFGTKIAVAGDYALIGAWYEDDASGNQSGKAYLFNVTTGVLLHTFDNPNAYGTSGWDYFGGIISLSDKHAIITSAYEDELGENQSGKAYVFVLDDTYETDAQSLLASIISVGEGSGIDASTLQGKTSLDFATLDDLSPYAKLASPTFTGFPQAPTQSPNNNSTIIATTAYADAAALTGGDPNFVGYPITFNLPTAPGSNAVAISSGADAKEQNGIAFGTGSQAGITDSGTGNREATAIGALAKAYNRNSLAIGTQAVAGLAAGSVFYATAIGWNSLSEGAEAIAIGSLSKALGYQAIAIGSSSEARESGGISIGGAAQTGQTNNVGVEANSIAIGLSAKAYESEGIAIGRDSVSGKNGTSVDANAIAIGFQADALEEDAVALGHWARARGTSAISIGDGAWAKETSSIAIGQNSITGQTDGAGNEGNSIAIGQAAKAYEIGCVSVGYLSSTGRNGTTNDPYAVAVGYFALADQGYTTAIGQSADARGTSSSAFGSNAQALESACVAVGASAEAGRAAGGTQNTNCVAIGAVAKAYNGYGIAIGSESIAGINSGNTEVNAIAIGKTAVAPKANTIAIGTDATVTNKGEMVIGLGTNAFEKKIVIQQAFTLATLTAFTDSPVIPINKAWKFTAEVIGRQDVTGEVASYKIEGIIKNIGGTTTIVGTNTSVAQEEDATWDCVIVANNTNDTLEIQFQTDGTANAVNVLANILIMEV